MSILLWSHFKEFSLLQLHRTQQLQMLLSDCHANECRESQDWNDYSFSFNYVNHGFLMKNRLNGSFLLDFQFPAIRLHNLTVPLPHSFLTSPFQPFFVGIRIETIGWDEYKITNCSRMKGFRGISFICVIVVAIAIFTADHHRTFRTIFQVFVVPFARRTVFPRTIINQDDQSCVCLRVFVLIFPLNWIWFIGDAQQRPNEKEYDRKDVKTVKSKWNGLLVRKSIE